MSRTVLLCAMLVLLPSSASAVVGSPPTVSELKRLVEDNWPSFSRIIQKQDRLNDVPDQLIDLPQTLCRIEQPATYECVSLVDYRLANGNQRSSLLRHNVSRNAQGVFWTP